MNADFFKHNRANISQKLGGGLLWLTAYTRMQRSNDSAHMFEQESNFWYLCGVEAPDWQLIIDGAHDKSWLIMPEIDEIHRSFDGALDPDLAKSISGVDNVITHDQASQLMSQLRRTHSMVYTIDQPRSSEHFNFSLNPAQRELRKKLERSYARVQSANKELAQLRAIKQPAEIAGIKAAIKLTVDAFEQIKSSIDSYTHEYEIEADFTRAFRYSGAVGHAYDPIVAAAGNACTLHYTANAAQIKKRELVLIDVGVRHRGYAADVTRTYARGEATLRQASVHSAVQQAQADIIKLLGPDISVEEYQRDVDRIMGRAMAQIGLGSADDLDMVRRYMPHAVSHGLGIDVHDSLGATKYLREGMVLTVEPGLYLPDERIGVRIEDDILITASGHQNLSRRLSTDL